MNKEDINATGYLNTFKRETIIHIIQIYIHYHSKLYYLNSLGNIIK
jgi:hypothetical protein